MGNLNTLILYYSRTGNTEKVAERLGESLNCHIEKINDKKNRTGIIGYFIAAKDAILGVKTEIAVTKEDISKYDIIIIGSPVWASHLAPAVRTYIEQNKDKIKKLAFFSTQGADEGKEFKVKSDLEKLTGKKLAAVLKVSDKSIENGTYKEKIEVFKADLMN